MLKHQESCVLGETTGADSTSRSVSFSFLSLSFETGCLNQEDQEVLIAVQRTEEETGRRRVDLVGIETETLEINRVLKNPVQIPLIRSCAPPSLP